MSTESFREWWHALWWGEGRRRSTTSVPQNRHTGTREELVLRTLGSIVCEKSGNQGSKIMFEKKIILTFSLRKQLT